MKIQTEADAQRAAEAAAAWIAGRARAAITDRHRFALALSGGSSPLPMFDALAAADIPWQYVSLYQVDERLVPADSALRNFAAIRERLLDRIAIPAGQVHPMPVESGDPRAAAAAYAETLVRTLGANGVLDLAHLGLGADGHTASLLPGDPAADEATAVIVSRRYQGTRRLSLSFSILSAARERAWLVTGADKRDALARLLGGDPDIPAGRVERRGSIVFTDLSVSPDTDRHRSPVDS
jgi:6-phosphogluconolactonase